METGNKAVDFSIPDQDENNVSLSQYKDKWIVLYFYPKDNTSGCTVEAIDFTSLKKDFDDLGAVIIGVSPDSVKSHKNFINKKELDIQLLSDPDHKVIESFGAWQLKKNYGREYYGVVRTTILIDKDGNIAHIWNKVKAKGHAEIVKNKLSDILSE